MSASTPSIAPDSLHVAAGVIRDDDGRILITRRPDHLHQGGLWEFPGGKLEPGESPAEALARELQEELGIRPGPMQPLIRVPWQYADRHVLLDVWEVEGFSGRPEPREGQQLARVPPSALREHDFPPADRPVLDALELPQRCLVTPPPGSDVGAFLARLEQALAGGVLLLILRAHGLAQAAYLELVAKVAALKTRHDFLLHGYGDPRQLAAAGADGRHLRAAELANAACEALPCSASCHDAAELQAAVRCGVRFALLSPVRPTRTHPQAEALGWRAFRALADSVPLPVYALGGLGAEDLATARRHGAQGVAAMRAFWPGPVA